MSWGMKLVENLGHFDFTLEHVNIFIGDALSFALFCVSEEPTWTCLFCTFANHEALEVCEMCEMPRNRVLEARA